MGRPKKINNEGTLVEQGKWTGKAKIKNEMLKDTSVVFLEGITVCFDKDGIAEVEEERAAKYLLSIPSYELLKDDSSTSKEAIKEEDVVLERDMLENE